MKWKQWFFVVAPSFGGLEFNLDKYQQMKKVFVRETDDYFFRLEEVKTGHISLGPNAMPESIILKAEWSLRSNQKEGLIKDEEIRTLKRADLLTSLLEMKLRDLDEDQFNLNSKKYQNFLQTAYLGLKALPTEEREQAFRGTHSEWWTSLFQTKGNLVSLADEYLNNLQDFRLKTMITLQKISRKTKVSEIASDASQLLLSTSEESFSVVAGALSKIFTQNLKSDANLMSVLDSSLNALDSHQQETFWRMYFQSAFEVANWKLMANIFSFIEQKNNTSQVLSEDQMFHALYALFYTKKYAEADQLSTKLLSSRRDPWDLSEIHRIRIWVFEKSRKDKLEPTVGLEASRFISELAERYRKALEFGWSSEHRDQVLSGYIQLLIDNGYLLPALHYSEILKRSGVYSESRIQGVLFKIQSLKKQIEDEKNTGDHKQEFRNYLTELSQLSRVEKGQINFDKEKSFASKYRKTLFLENDVEISASYNEIFQKELRKKR